MSDIATNVKRHEKSRMSKQGSSDGHGTHDTQASLDDDVKRMEESVQLKMSSEHTQSRQNTDVAGDLTFKMRAIRIPFRK